VGGRVEALAAGVEDEGVALIGEAEPAVLVHRRIPRADEEGDGNDEEEASGHGGKLVTGEVGSGVKRSAAPPLLSSAGAGGQNRDKSQRMCPPRPSVGNGEGRPEGVKESASQTSKAAIGKPALKTDAGY
jgi:hypothetical protein